VSVSIKPLEDRIVVLPVEAEQVTASGLVPLDIAVGDRVIFSKYGGTELKMNGKEYLVLSARDVLAIVER